ncbi:splicing factor, arginine/serine-rich 19-like [Hordeum vulgare]|nr:splicing factor, arginine/serine-rich 19-like [Hordeum vulgare]
MEPEPEPEPDRDVSLLPPAPNPSHQPSLRAAKSTAFKREERRKHKEQKRERKRQESLALALEQWEPLGAPPRPAATSPPGAPADDKPWPCDPPPPADAAPSAAWGWGPPAEPSADRSWGLPAEPPTQPPVAARCPQAAAVRACRALFGEHADDDDEEGEEEEGDATRFFDELLEKDAGLRGLYEAERETGRFLCLVCEGIGARAGKRFPGCAALVQHAGSVARTKRRLAHRAFADAVGRLLGWGAGRTTPFPADCDNDGAVDQAEHLDASECAEMEAV